MSAHTDAILSPSGAPVKAQSGKAGTSTPPKRAGRPKAFSDLSEEVKAAALQDHLVYVHEMPYADVVIDYYGIPFEEAQAKHLAIRPHLHTGQAPA